MIGLALSGGGSRAMAFHLGCFRALEDLGLLEKVAVLSTISGGSVFGAYYAYSPDIRFDEFDRQMQTLLLEGLQGQLVVSALMPQNLARGGWGVARRGLHRLTKWDRGQKELPVRSFSRTELFAQVLQRRLFGKLALEAPTKSKLEVIIGACDLRTGTAFRFSSEIRLWPRSRSYARLRYVKLPPDEAVPPPRAAPILAPMMVPGGPPMIVPRVPNATAPATAPMAPSAALSNAFSPKLFSLLLALLPSLLFWFMR